MFFELKQNEKVVICMRRHWLVLSLRLIWFIPAFFTPFAIWLIFSLYLETPIPYLNPIFWLLSSIWWLFSWAALAVTWVNNYLDYWIVTNQRVLSTYQKGLFRREVSELSFSRVQDISVSVKGILKTFINYGDLEIRTAGTFDISDASQQTNIVVFEDISKPYEVQNLLSKIHHDYVKANHSA